MADETKKPTAEEKAAAIKAYHDADTKDKKAEAVKQFPFLRELYSEVNHS